MKNETICRIPRCGHAATHEHPATGSRFCRACWIRVTSVYQAAQELHGEARGGRVRVCALDFKLRVARVARELEQRTPAAELAYLLPCGNA